MRYWLMVGLVFASCGSSTSNPFSPKPVHPDAIQRACAMEVSCFTDPPITPAGDCVTQFEEGLATGAGIFFGPSASDLQRYVDCANSSHDCTSALTCASKNHGPDWCNAHPMPSCDGDLLVGCVNGWGLEQTDCAALGEHCATANGVSLCTDGKSCDPSTAERCDGNHLVSCDSTASLESSLDCGALVGGTCVDNVVNGSGEIGCFPPASASCAMDGETCQGTTAVICESGRQFTVACGQFASHCVIDGTGKYQCVPDASSCSPTMADACVGNALQMCVNGNLAQTPCSDIGLTTCQATSGAAKCM